jgi:Uma2 family endonuclease
MAAVLELPELRKRVHLLSVDEYHCLPSENVELLRGLVVTKMPKSPLHALVSHKTMKRLQAQTPPGYEVRREDPLTFIDSEPEPDLSVVRGSPDDWAQAHPGTAQLVVEVAVSSVAIDQFKANIYAEAGIPEYWLMRPEDRAVDVYRQPTPQGYLSKATVREPEILRCVGIPGIEIDLSEIFPKSST